MDYPKSWTTPRHLSWTTFSQFLLIGLCLFFLQTDGEVKVIWAQQSRSWTKLRGILGPPSQWAYDDAVERRYVSTSAEHGRNWYALGYDHRRELLYWSDRVHGGIYVQNYSSAMYERPSVFRVVLESTSRNVRGLTVDTASGTVYFTDHDNQWVAMTTAQNNQKNVFKTLHTKDVEAPGGIVVDSGRGLVYWADLSPMGARIEVSTLQGTERGVVVRDVWPASLALDTKDNRLYWPDSRHDDLRYLDLSRPGLGAQQVRKLEEATHAGEELYPGIGVYDNIVLLSDTKALRIAAYDKNTGAFLAEQITDATPYDLEIPPMQLVPDVVCVPGSACQDLCLNLGSGKGSCSCQQGHYLELDHTSCISSKPRYIYSMGQEVWTAAVQIDGRYADRLTMNETVYVGNFERVQSLGFHHGEDLLYMGDTLLDSIYRGHPDSLDDLIEITVNTGQVEGISVDWVSGTMYWTDAEFGHVMCAQLDGRYHRIVLEVNTTRGRPSGLAVDPINGRLYWAQFVDGQPGAGSIQSSRLDGSEVVTVINGSLSRPQAVAVDTREQRLYWTDRELFRVEVSDLLGRDRRMIHDLSSVYGLTIFQDYTTWTQNHRGLRFGIASEERPLRSPEAADPNYPLADHQGNAFDVVLYGNYLQPKPIMARDLCRHNNGGCQHHCVIMPSGHVCACAIGFRLAADGTSCEQDLLFDKFLLFTDPYHKQVYQQQREGGPVQGVPAPLQDYPISADYDPYTGRLFWIDQNRKEIASSRLDGVDKKVVITIKDGMRPIRLALHPTKEMLCFTDLYRGTVACVGYSGEDLRDIVTNLDNPYGLAIDTDENLLYWTEAGRLGSGRVGRAQLDGSNRVYVSDIGGSPPENPKAIAVWPKSQMVYWADETAGRILALNTSTQKLDTLVEVPSMAIHTLAVDDAYAYFSAWHEKTVFRVALDAPGEPEEFHKAVFARITDLKVFDHDLPQPFFVSTGGGGGGVVDFPWMYVGIGVGALLLALLLLFGLIFGLRNKKKHPKAPPSGHELGTGFDDSEVEREYVGFQNGTLFDMRNSRAGNAGYTNEALTQDTPVNAGPPYNTQPNGQANDFHQNGHAQGYQQGFDNTDGYPSNGHAGGHPELRTSGDTPDVISGLAVAAVAAATNPRPKKNHYKKRERPPPPQPNPNDFQLSEDKRVATVIARLATRLRNRLSTIRWSGHDTRPQLPQETDPPRDLEEPGDPEAHEDLEHHRRHRVVRKESIDVPPQLHRPPRGFAPASPFVPSNVKSTWGRSKTMANAPKKH